MTEGGPEAVGGPFRQYVSFVLTWTTPGSLQLSHAPLSFTATSKGFFSFSILARPLSELGGRAPERLAQGAPGVSTQRFSAGPFAESAAFWVVTVQGRWGVWWLPGGRAGMLLDIVHWAPPPGIIQHQPSPGPWAGGRGSWDRYQAPWGGWDPPDPHFRVRKLGGFKNKMILFRQL